MAADDAGSIAVCDGQRADSGMCLLSCSENSCAEGTVCLAGACISEREATHSVSLDPAIKYQSLIGFGASLALGEELIVNHPDKAALYDAMFLDSGFNIIRFRNRYDAALESDFSAASEIISAAQARIDDGPTLFMTSGSPPAALKENGALLCARSDVDCTLIRDEDGEYNYAAFAEHWRASLEAYESEGIHPDFVSIQNNADFIPPDDTADEACRFLPEEGTMSVTSEDGETVDAHFAGYTEALTAVIEAVGTLPVDYSFSGPEAGSVIMVDRYTNSLNGADSISYHVYGAKLDDAGIEQLESLRVTADEAQKPLIQSEMQANGLDTAILAQMNLAIAGASAYLQQSFVSTGFDDDSAFLIGTDETSFRKLPAYHALSHFARSTAPGWTRIEATFSESLLSSAWISPDERALTVILVNPEAEAIDIELSLPGPATSLLNNATIVRTVFDGAERSAELGPLPDSRVMRMPARSIATIAGRAD